MIEMESTRNILCTLIGKAGLPFISPVSKEHKKRINKN